MRQRIAFYTLSLVIGIALFLGYVPDNDTAFKITREHTRSIFIALHLVFFLSAVDLLWRARDELRKRLVEKRRFVAWSALVVLAAALFSCTRENTNYKVTADEYVLSLEAMSLHFEGTSTVPLRLHVLGGMPRYLGGTINKRPPAFATLLSLIHDVTGYRSANVFYLNKVLVVGFFGLLFGYVCRLFGGAAAGFACALWACFPLFHQNASGGGFEVLNLVYLLLFLLAATEYLQRPSLSSQRVYLLTVLLLANTRYESSLFVLAAGGVILFQWIRDRKIFTDVSLFLAPLVMSTFLLRIRVFEHDQQGNWQVAKGQAPFSLDYVFDNIGHATNYFLAFSRSSTTSEYLWITGFIGGVFLLYGCAKDIFLKQRREFQLPIFAVALVILANFVLLMFYHWGQLSSPEVSRLGLPLALLATLGSVFLFFRVFTAPAVRTAAWMTLVVFAVGVALPRGALAASSHSNFHVRRADWLLGEIQRLPPDGYVVASIDTGRLFLERIPGLPIGLLNERVEEAAYHLRLSSYKLLVAQRYMIDAKTGAAKVVDDDWLHPAFRVEPIAENSFRPFVVVRFGRIVAVDPELAKKSTKEIGPLATNRMSGTVSTPKKPPGADVAPVSAEEVIEWINKLP